MNKQELLEKELVRVYKNKKKISGLLGCKILEYKYFIEKIYLKPCETKKNVYVYLFKLNINNKLYAVIVRKSEIVLYKDYIIVHGDRSIMPYAFNLNKCISKSELLKLTEMEEL